MGRNPSIQQSDSSVPHGKDVWNISDTFMRFKVSTILIEIDEIEKMAFFGKKNISEEVLPEQIPLNRVEAMNQYPFLLRQLIGNCKFTLERKNKNMVDNFSGRIDGVESVLGGISFYTSNELTKENNLNINELHFRKCFNILRTVKDELNKPLDDAGLIFRRNEEIDLNDLMRNVIEGN